MHQQLSDPNTFSQHQPMERDDSGMVAPTNIFHQPMGLPISMYGGTIIPSHPQLADVPGGPLFNGLHNPDPAWNPMIKVIQNSTECTDAQQASVLSSVPALKGEIPSPQLTRPKKRVGQPIVASSNQRHQLLPSCCSLCPRPRVAQFQGPGTSCQTATAPRLAAHYTPLPREAPGSSTTESSCWSAKTHPLPGHLPAASLRSPGSQFPQQYHPSSWSC